MDLQYTYRSSTSFLGNPDFPQEKILPNDKEARIHAWKQFFEDNRMSKVCFFDYTIKALLTHVAHSELLFSQSEKEFQCSQQFYRILFEQQREMLFTNQKAANTFFALSLLYGKYPGMFKRSIREIISNSPVQMDQNVVLNMASSMLISYETPRFILNNLLYLNSEEAEVFMRSLKGEKMRVHPYFQFQLTPHQFTELMQLDIEGLQNNDHPLLRGAIFIRLREKINDDHVTACFLNAVNDFVFFPEKFACEIVFWGKALELIYEAMDEHLLNITDMVDFLESRRREDPGYSLKGRTPTSLGRAALEWHDTVYNRQHAEIANMTWEKSPHPDLHFNLGSKEYRCRQLNTGNLLIEEGNNMKHCVSSYAYICASTPTRIWSLEQKSKKGFVSALTIEVRNNTIVQARGKHNALPKKEQLKALMDWASRLNMEVELVKNE